ncbi:MAG TPA: hypothetical protein VJ761_13075, partial [Ktedonobacteraceae bacterium]|nr:hypothetical protein [Ktedonobacteraceae bacterium]
MPVLASTGEITPKSALRHRPIGNDTDQQGQKAAFQPVPPVAQRASRKRSKQTEGNAEVKPDQTTADEEVSEWRRADNDTK